jgi:serpin B
MYRRIGMGTDNFFFSPYSIVSALGMTDAGARGETDRQIREALSVTLEGDGFHAAMNGLDRDLMGHASTTDHVTLSVVNSAWTQTGHPFRAAYLDLLARYYGAGVNLLDFATKPDESRIVINDWVSEQTNDKIKDLLPSGSITTYTRLVLTNAVYFLADWLYTFDMNNTDNATFTRLDGSTVDAPLMQLGDDNEQVTLLYAWDGANRVRMLQLPYKGDRLAMTLFLPEAGSFDSFEQALSVSLLSSLTENLDSTSLPPVRIPKFTYKSSSISLKAAFQELGMVDAFDAAAADFSGIDGEKWLYVSDIRHKSFIAVDEQGTEAAAATAVIISRTSIPTHIPRFVADRPFVYCIRDTRTGVIIFMGKVTDPLLES